MLWEGEHKVFTNKYKEQFKFCHPCPTVEVDGTGLKTIKNLAPLLSNVVL